MDENEKRVDLNSELGMSRRDLIRRGAIVGGTLLWAAPAIQSINAGVAHAQEAGASAVCASCYCQWNRRNGTFVADACYSDGPTGVRESPEACAAWCVDPDNDQFVEAVSHGARPRRTQSDQCQGTTGCHCSSGNTGVPIPDRAVCP
jgi:hypothetical protein